MSKTFRLGIDYIGVSAGAVIYNETGLLFMAKRSNGARDDQGKWEFPGGQVRMFEGRQKALRRILKGKYDIEVSIDKMLGVYEVIDKKFGDHWISTTYICTHKSGKPKIMQEDKCDEVAWKNISDLNKMQLSRITQLNLSDIKSIKF